MLKLKSFLCYLVLLSLAFPLGNAWAKKPRFNKDSVSAITLDVVRMEACASGKGCVTASGPMQLDLLELADGKVDFANQVLLPEKTQYLQLMFGENSTITVDDELFPLSVPGGTKSGLKLKGRKAFGKEGGFLTSLELQFKLGKKIVAQRNKIRSKDKGQRRQVSYVYSYKLKPVIKVATAEVEALPENIAAVVALPNEEVTLTLGDDFSMRIPAGAVSEATIITAEELKYFVEVKDEATGEIVRKPGLASTYELGPEGTQFDKPLKVAIGYHTDTLPSRISENDLAVFHDGKRVLSDIETASQVAVADISHFSTVTVSYGVCEETVVEDGIIYRNCGDKTGYPDMHVVLADRVKLRNSYKLKVLAKNEWNGRFTTQTVEQLANTNNAIVAINASYFSLTPEDYSVEVPGAFTTQTTIMNNIVMQDREYGNEVAIAFGDDGKDSSIPIRRISKEELIMRSYDMEAGNLPEGDCSYITEKVRKGYNIDSGKSYVEDINECYRERKEWSGKCFNIIDSYMSTVSGMTSMTLEQQLERHNEFVTDFVDCESGKWARNVASLIDFISPPLDFSEVAQFKSSNILSSTVGVRFTVLERNEGAKESTCKYQGDSLDEPASAIGYSDKDIIFVSSDMFLFADRQFDTWNSLCEVFRVQGGEAEAVQLDSGCSPQLVVNGELKNGYCRWEDGEERHVLNAIGLVPINREIPEPSQAIVDSVSPSTATLNERTLFTVTGLRLSSDLRFSLDGCENVDQILANSTTMVFLCTPRAVGNRSGTIEDFFYNRIFDFTVTVFDEPSTLPVVTSVSPGEAVLDEQTIFTVTGQNLPSTLAFFVEECANLQSLGGTSTSMLFRCIPSWTTGLKDGVVKDESGGTTLYSFQVNVSDETPVTSPIVNSVTPTEAVLNQPTTFTVSGQNLPSTLAFWIGECDNVTSLGGSSTLMKFSCTPSWTLGIKNGVVKDQHGGTPLKEFTVDVSDAPSDDDLVLKEVRVTANGTLYAGSTATYTAVADLAENITTGSIPVAGDVVKTIEVTDECSWLVTLGMYADSLGGGLVQAESSAAGQEVKVKCTYYHSPSNLNLTGTLSVVVSGGSTTSPVVYSVTPDEAVLGESTVFTVSGQDLPSTLAFWIEECENLTSLGGTSTSKQFRCTPSWTTGLKDGVVKDQSGGTVLYNFTVDVSNVPATSPVVYSVTPTEAALEETTTFTVNGENLPSTLEFLLTDCTGVRSLGGSSTARQFSCTPRIRTGQKDGIIEQSGGSVLKTFTVDFL